LRLSVVCLALVSLVFFSTTTYAASDLRQRFEGLVGKTLQAAWYHIDKAGSYFH